MNIPGLPPLRWPFTRGQTLLVLLIAAAAPPLWYALRRFDSQIAREHGPIENFQVLCIVGSMAIMALAGLLSKDRAVKVFCFGLMLFNTNLFVLEFDTREWNNDALNFFFTGKSRSALLGAAWLLAAIAFVRNARAVWQVFQQWLFTRSGVLLLISGLFWVLGWLSDRIKPLSPDECLMLEEAVESNATIFMVASAALAVATLRKTGGSLAEAKSGSHRDIPTSPRHITTK